jgi:hypothetical protein
MDTIQDQLKYNILLLILIRLYFNKAIVSINSSDDLTSIQISACITIVSVKNRSVGEIR